MTADWARLPYDCYRDRNRIVNESPPSTES